MKNINTVLGLLFVFSFLPLFSSAQLASNTTEIDKKVDELLKKMTLEEKVGQMNQYNGFWEITGPAPKDGNAKLKYDHLKRGLVGSVLNVKGVENVRKIQEIVVSFLKSCCWRAALNSLAGRVFEVPGLVVKADGS